MSHPFDQTKGWQIKPPGDLNFSTVEVQLNIEKVGWRKHRENHPGSNSMIPSSGVGCFWGLSYVAGTGGLILPLANRIRVSKQLPQTAIRLLLLFIKGIIIALFVFYIALLFLEVLKLGINKKITKNNLNL